MLSMNHDCFRVTTSIVLSDHPLDLSIQQLAWLLYIFFRPSVPPEEALTRSDRVSIGWPIRVPSGACRQCSGPVLEAEAVDKTREARIGLHMNSVPPAPPLFSSPPTPMNVPGGSRKRKRMSKLSHQLKALINAPAARPNTVPAPSNIQSIYRKIQQGAQSQNLSQSSWLALSVGVLFPIPPLLAASASAAVANLSSTPNRQPPP